MRENEEEQGKRCAMLSFVRGIHNKLNRELKRNIYNVFLFQRGK